MKKLKMGTPQMGIVIGCALAAAAALVMVIGFWKVLLLAALFGIGYFIGTVANKQEFIKETANKIIPAKDAQVIDIKSEITRTAEQAPAAEEETEEAEETEENEEDGE